MVVKVDKAYLDAERGGSKRCCRFGHQRPEDGLEACHAYPAGPQLRNRGDLVLGGLNPAEDLRGTSRQHLACSGKADSAARTLCESYADLRLEA
jgi:hypothetical protein